MSNMYILFEELIVVFISVVAILIKLLHFIYIQLYAFKYLLVLNIRVFTRISTLKYKSKL